MSYETTLNQAWMALCLVRRSAFTCYDIKEIVGLAGFPVTRLAPLVKRHAVQQRSLLPQGWVANRQNSP